MRRMSIVVLSLSMSYALSAEADPVSNPHYAKAVSDIAEELKNPSEAAREKPEGALEKLEFQASRPGAEEERKAYVKAVGDALDAAQTVPAQTWLLRSLERVGKDEALASEAKLLNAPDEHVRELAARAIANNPSPAAIEILRKALDAAKEPRAHSLLLAALAYHRDGMQFPIFEKEAQSDDPEIKATAQFALRSYGKAPDPDMAQAAALIGLGRSGEVSYAPKILEALSAPNLKVRQAAAQALGLNTNPEWTKILAEKLPSQPAEAKLAIIAVLAQRNGKIAVPALKPLLTDENPAVRLAALRALGQAGDVSCVPVLFSLALEGKPDEKRAARDSLDSLRGENIDAAIAKFLDDPESAHKVESAERLAARVSAASVPKILTLLEDKEPAVRSAALKTAAAAGSRETLPPMLAFLNSTSVDSERELAAKALLSITRRLPDSDNRDDALAEAAVKSNEPARVQILGVLGQLGGKKSSAAVHAALKDPSEKIKDAAMRALAGWPDAEPMGELLDMAKTSTNEVHRVLALRGYFRMAGLPGKRTGKERIEQLVAGLAAAKKPDEIKMGLSGLAETNDFSAMDTVVKYLDDESVREEAAAALVKGSKNFAKSHRGQVNELMTKVANVAKNQQTRKAALDLMAEK